MPLRPHAITQAVAVALGFCLLMFALPGCGGDGSDSPDPAGDQTPSVATNDPPALEPAGNTDPPQGEDTPTPTAGPSPADEPPVEPAPPSRLPFDLTEPLVGEGYTVRWATWGSEDGTRTTDVTERVRAMVAEEGMAAWSPEVFNEVAGDPMPGEDKWLVLVVDTPTRALRIGLSDHSNVYFTVPANRVSPHGSEFQWKDDEAARAREMLGPDGFEGTGVVWARWGNDGRRGGWADAYVPVGIQVNGSDRIVNKTHNIGVPAQSRHQRKTLRVLVSIDGQPLDLHLRSYSYLIDEPTAEHLEQPEPQAIGDADRRYIVARLDGRFNASSYLLGPDGRFVYALDTEQHTLLKLDAQSLEVMGLQNDLPEGLVTLAMAPDNDTIYLGGPVNGFEHGRDPAECRGNLLRVSAQTMQHIGRRRQVRVDIRKLMIDDTGRILAVNGSSGTWAFVAVIDPQSYTIVGKVEWVSAGNAYEQLPDRQRFYYGHTNGIGIRWVVPGSDPVHAWGGDPSDAIDPKPQWNFDLTAHGTAVVSHDGSVLGVSRYMQNDLYGIGQIDENAAGLISPELGLLLLSIDDGLKLYSWPLLRPLGETQHRGVLVDLELSPDGRHAYAQWMPDAEFKWIGNIDGDKRTVLVAIDLAALVPEGFEPDPTEAVPAPGEHALVTERLPLRTDVTDMVLAHDRRAVFVLDAAQGVVHRLNAQTLEIETTSDTLPLGARRIALDPRGGLLAVSSAPTGYHGNKEHAGGEIVFLNPANLDQIGETIDCPLDPDEIAFVHSGRLIVAGGSNQWTHMMVIDPRTGEQARAQEGIRQRDPIAATPDGRVFFRCGHGSSLSAIRVDGRGGFDEQAKIPLQQAGHATGGPQMWTATDSKTVIMMGGGVYSIDLTWRTQQVTPLGTIGVVTAAAAAGELLFANDRTNTLTAYRLPSLEPVTQALFDGVLEQLCYDPDAQRLYAVYWPERTMEHFEQYDGPAVADIICIDVAAMLAD